MGRPVVVCNDAHRLLVAEQLELAGIQPEAIILDKLVAAIRTGNVAA